MCRNLDLRFLLFYCLLSIFFHLFSLSFFGLAFYCLFSFCRIGFCFYRLSFSLFFFDIVLFMFFLAHVISSLVYPNLLGNKMLGCCCCWLPVKNPTCGVLRLHVPILFCFYFVAPVLFGLPSRFLPLPIFHSSQFFCSACASAAAPLLISTLAQISFTR
jgi:hypothetical protein